MVQKLLFAFLFLLSICTIDAQVTYGLLGGMCSSEMTGDNYSGFNKAGPFLGVFANTCVGANELEFNLVYVQKGSVKNPDPANNDQKAYRANLNYLELPVMIRFANSKFEYELGAATGYLLSSSEQNEVGLIQGEPFKNIEFSGLAGAHYVLSDKIKLAIRYNRSIIPVRNHTSGAVVVLNAGQYINAINFFLKYTI